MTDCEKGVVVAIFAEGKQHPLAIGKISMSTSDIKEALGAWKGALLGLASILVITPFFGLVPLEAGEPSAPSRCIHRR